VESRPCAKNAQGWGTQGLWVGHPPPNVMGGVDIAKGAKCNGWGE
jgi:hypothetical protein